MAQHPSTIVRTWKAVRRIVGREPSAQEVSIQTPQSYVPAGHYYSPIPSVEDIDAFERRVVPVGPLPAIDLRETEQLALLEHLATFYDSLPDFEAGAPDLRFRLDNESYSFADAVFLHTMLRHLRPRRLIEVGSGYTSALTLDTNDRFLDGRLDCCFIEPRPALLMSLLTDADRQRCRVIPARLQDVDLSLFDTLGAGDVLFIDSTHVAKVNSDVNRLFFEILPRLAVGTIVHIHDVFPSFEYSVDWLRQGRAWNEQYLLRAFLEFNDRFAVRLFGAHMIQRHPDWFRVHMPLCLRNPGGAFWMQRLG